MSSRSLNKVLLIGNLTHDPELRYTPQGTAVCTFSVATNRSWIDSSGQQQEEVQFHRIVAWQKLAELCNQLLFRGRKVFVEGRLQTRKWTGQDGQERQTTEIVIDNMLVLDSRRKENEAKVNYAAARQKPTASVLPADAGAKAASDDISNDDNVKQTARLTSDKNATDDFEIKGEPREKEKKEAKKSGKNEEVKAEDIPF